MLLTVLLVVLQEWIHENNVLSVIISGNFHEPQYMEKWNKIVCFMMKEEALSLRDLDILWQAQVIAACVQVLVVYSL